MKTAYKLVGLFWGGKIMAIKKSAPNPKMLELFAKVELTGRSVAASRRARNRSEEIAIKITLELAVAIKIGDAKRITKLSKSFQTELKKSAVLQKQISRSSAQIGKLGLLAIKII